MSSHAPKELGGTRPNTDQRFDLMANRVDEDTEQTNDAKPSYYTEQADDDVPEVTTVESMCMNCEENGETKLLLTLIPYFREVILMSFECEHCGYKNSEVQFGGQIQDMGTKISLSVETPEDLNRQIIKSDTATISFPEIEFEIPAKTQRGTINTLEGVLGKATKDLRMNLDERRTADPETTAKLEEFLAKLALMTAGINLPFTIVVDDPAGNSNIENPSAPQNDPKLKEEKYYRSEAQDLECGLQPDQSHETPSQTPKQLPNRNEGLDKFVEGAGLGRKEVLQFPGNCYACGKPGMSNVCVTDIPHFKEVIIMSYNCDECGFKTNEIKAGGAIPPQGERITLHVDPFEDKDVMDRDVLKSDSASVTIPEIELEMQHGSLGGLYTTVEGLLGKIRKNIEEGNPFAVGDSDGGRSKLKEWFDRLESLKQGQQKFTLIVEDPLANSFVYSPAGSAEDDSRMTSELFTRSADMDEELGLTDMNTDDYDGESEDPMKKELKKLAEEIRSDKETMGGGKALDPQSYHPYPNAVQEMRNQMEFKTIEKKGK